jgi:hypothetical protein
MAAVVLSGCVALPGKDDLEANGKAATIEVKGDPEGIADCIAEKFDREPWSLMNLPTPVNGFRPNSKQKTVEISSRNTTAGPGYYWWIAKITGLDDTRSRIDIMARKNVNPYLSNDWMVNKVTSYAAACGSERH